MNKNSGGTLFNSLQLLIPLIIWTCCKYDQFLHIKRQVSKHQWPCNNRAWQGFLVFPVKKHLDVEISHWIRSNCVVLGAVLSLHLGRWCCSLRDIVKGKNSQLYLFNRCCGHLCHNSSWSCGNHFQLLTYGQKLSWVQRIEGDIQLTFNYHLQEFWGHSQLVFTQVKLWEHATFAIFELTVYHKGLSKL